MAAIRSTSTAPRDETLQLRIQLFGKFVVAVNARTISDTGWHRRKSKSLVELLALAPEHRLHRDQVLDQLWRDLGPTAAANNLYQTLYLARRLLDPTHRRDAELLVLQDEFLILAPKHTLWIDVEQFELAANHARRTKHTSDYRSALELYAGDLLPDERYADWASARREALRQEYVALSFDLAELYQARGESDPAMETLKRVLENDAAHEVAHQGLMRLYAVTGNRPQAIHQYETLREILARELDLTPDATSEKLYQQILAGEIPARAEISTRITEPAHDNLPVPTTGFIGRERAIREVTHLLATTRLLTLTGPGGCGKTRLALEIGRKELETYADGVWFVELASLAQAELVPRALAAVLGVQEVATQPLSGTLAKFLKSKKLLLVLDNCEHLIDACAGLAHSLLRVCPDVQILATSREPLRITGELTWQVPSLMLPDPKRLPPLAELNQYEAVQLFVERVRAVNSQFELTAQNAAAVANVCFHLDGIPLALELAAARVNVLAVEQICARLDDRFQLLTRGSRTALNRQQTLRATLDWSYDLLSEQERVLFRRLAVFAGGCSLEAVGFVYKDEGESYREIEKKRDAEEMSLHHALAPSLILDLLSRLVDKSLVVVDYRGGEARYGMLETIREYARQRLDESGETLRARGRHRDWYIAFLERANSNLWRAEQGKWLNRLETEYDNSRAVLAWCLAHDVESGLCLAVSLCQFWIVRGYIVEGHQWLERLLTRSPMPTQLRAQALEGLAKLVFRLADAPSAIQRIGDALSIYQKLGDRVASSRAQQGIGGVLILLEEFARAQALLDESLQLADETGSAACRALSTHFLGVAACAMGEYDRAQIFLDQSLALLRALPDEPNITSVFVNVSRIPVAERGYRHAHIETEETVVLLRAIGTEAAIGYALTNLGQLARYQSNYSHAREWMDKSLAQFRQIGDQMGISQVLGQLGNLSKITGDYRGARELLESSLALRREIGDQRGIGRTIHNLADLAILEGDLDRARALSSEGAELFQRMSDKPGIAASILSMGNLAFAECDYAGAESLYERSIAVYRELGVKYPLGILLLNLALCARRQGDKRQERARLYESLAIFLEIGQRQAIAVIEAELFKLGE